MFEIIQSVWKRMYRPPWVSLYFSRGERYTGWLECEVVHEKRNRREFVSFDDRNVFKADDPYTIRYVARVLSEALEKVTINTIDAAVGSIDVYRDDY